MSHIRKQTKLAIFLMVAVVVTYVVGALGRDGDQGKKSATTEECDSTPLPPPTYLENVELPPDFRIRFDAYFRTIVPVDGSNGEQQKTICGKKDSTDYWLNYMTDENGKPSMKAHFDQCPHFPVSPSILLIGLATFTWLTIHPLSSQRKMPRGEMPRRSFPAVCSSM